MGSRYRRQGEYLTRGQRADQKRQRDDALDRQEGYGVWQDAPDDTPLKKRWGLCSDLTLIAYDVEQRSKWIGPIHGGHWSTPYGDVKTVGDGRRLADELRRREREKSAQA